MALYRQKRVKDADKRGKNAMIGLLSELAFLLMVAGVQKKEVFLNVIRRAKAASNSH